MNATFDVTDVFIETPRLVLRPWKEADLEDLYEYASVPGVGEMAGWRHHPSREVSGNVLQMFIQGKRTFALELKKNGKVIGSLGIEYLDMDPMGTGKYGREIGYVLSRDYWGQELMPEAVRAVISYCFDRLHYDFLTCGHFVQNSQSARVIEKCGFSFLAEAEYKTQLDTCEICRNYILRNTICETV